MSSEFDRPLYGFRFVEVLFGDTLQAIAARELGDASNWVDLINYNGLVPPFLVDDPSLAGPGVLASGSLIKVPAPAPIVNSTTDPDKVFEIDIGLDENGMLQTDGLDFVVVAGRANLRQALKNALETEQGDLAYHTSYGSSVRRIVGTVNGPTASLLGAQYAKSTVKADSRISSVKSSTAVVTGDVIRVTVSAEAVDGRVIDVTANP